jgi:site-specific recombinase XerD
MSRVPRTPHRHTGRRRVATGIYRDRYGYAARVWCGGLVVERRFPKDATLREMKAWQDHTRAIARQRQPARERGTLAADVERYLNQMRHLASWIERRAHLRAWLPRLGRLRRFRITREHVQAHISRWAEAGVAPKTIWHRVQALRHLYRTLDGRRVVTPCDDVSLPALPRHVPVVVSPEVVRRVEAELRARERRGLLRDAKTRARFMVLATTGRRPSELMRAQPEDVDLERRVWAVRDGKGGWSAGIYLNDDMLTAWRLFLAAQAWGSFNTGSFARCLRAAGWPSGVRPYHLRHSIGLALSEHGADLADVAAFLGHTRTSTTRRHYVPVLGSRLEALSRALDGRFGWGTEDEIVSVARGRERQDSIKE